MTYLRVSDVAQAAGVSRDLVYSWIRRGLLRPSKRIRLGGSRTAMVFSETSVVTFLAHTDLMHAGVRAALDRSVLKWGRADSEDRLVAIAHYEDLLKGGIAPLRRGQKRVATMTMVTDAHN